MFRLATKRYFRVGSPHFKLRDFKLADIGEGNAEAQILKWSVAVGDHIKEFQNICEVQSDKVTTELSSSLTGQVVKIHYREGDMARVYTPLITVDVGEEPEDDMTPQTTPTEDTSLEKTLKKVGLATIQTDSGPGSTDSLLFAQTQSESKPLLMLPSARHFAKMNGVDLSRVVGTGKAGRILKQDLVNHLSHNTQPLTSAQLLTQATSSSATTTHPLDSSATSSSSSPLTSSTSSSTSSRLLTMVEKGMYKSMTKANAIPHFVYTDEIDVEALMGLREKYIANQHLAGMHDGRKKLTLMPFFFKAVSLALAKYPIINSRLIDGEDLNEVRVESFSHHHIGFAMDTPSGLLVPHIKYVEDLSIGQINREIERIQSLGAEGRLSKDILNGSTITLSNIGSIGGTVVKPILFAPQVAICGIGRAQEVFRPDLKTKAPVLRRVVHFSWAGDHRILDGATVAKFSNLVKFYLENPEVMLIN